MSFLSWLFGEPAKVTARRTQLEFDSLESRLVPYAATGNAWMNPQLVSSSAALRAKAGFLTPNFFVLRTVIYFFLWSLWVGSIYRQSTKQDTERSIKQMHIASRWSARR